MIKNFKEAIPEIEENCFIADSADIIGSVYIGNSSNIWFGSVIRADVNYVKVGNYTNIQDNSVIHVDYNSPVLIGDRVTIGHNSIIHGCEIAEDCLIGMGAIVLNGAKIGKNTIIGAGSLITQNKVIPEGSLVMGSPAKVVRKLTNEEIQSIRVSSERYVELSKEYK